MSGLLDYLESFNRKERFFLVGMALGNPAFRLGEEFTQKLRDTFDIPVPQDAPFAAMDYHLDWLHASIFLFQHGEEPKTAYLNNHNGNSIASGNQEDVDFIIGFESNNGMIHVIMLEAKAETGWTNDQMQSKANRLEAIFGDNQIRGVQAHFALVSPRPPQRLRTAEWPDWMRSGEDSQPLHLPLPPLNNRRLIVRTDENGINSALGNHFKIVRKRWTPVDSAPKRG